MRGVVVAVATLVGMAACTSFGADATTPAADAGAAMDGGSNGADAPDGGPLVQRASTALENANGTASATTSIVFDRDTTVGDMVVVIASSSKNAATGITPVGGGAPFGAILVSNQHVEISVANALVTAPFHQLDVVFDHVPTREVVIVASEWRVPGKTLSYSSNKHGGGNDAGPFQIETDTLAIKTTPSLLVAVAGSTIAPNDPIEGFTSVAGDSAGSTWLSVAWRMADGADSYSATWPLPRDNGWDSFLLGASPP